MTTQTYEIRPIGRARVSEGEFYRLEILEPIRPALKSLDQFSHVMVFWWADKHDTDDARNFLQARLPYAPDVEAGVFACRSPLRPNPVLLTTCPLLSVDEEKGIVELAWIDAFDGTPIVDLKPYVPVSDRIRDVKVPDWIADWPEWMEDGETFFTEGDVDLGG